MGSLTIDLYDSAINHLGIIDNPEDFSFTRSAYEVGAFTLKINVNANAANIGYLVKNNLIMVNQDPYKSGIITKISTTISENGKGSQVLTVQGYELKALIKRRLIFQFNTSNPDWAKTSDAESVIKQLISDQCGPTCTTASRVISTLSIGTNQYRGASTIVQGMKYSSVYALVSAIATQALMSWYIYLDVTNKKLVLDVSLGLDRSTDQSSNPWAIFSPDRGTIKEADVEDSDDSAANLVYVGGSGSGSSRLIQPCYYGASEPTDLARIEMFDDQSSLTTVAECVLEGANVLNQYLQTISVSGQQLPSSPLAYRQDYDLGDYVEINNDYSQYKARIISVQEEWKAASYQLSMTFGKPVASLSRQVFEVTNKAKLASSQSEAGKNINASSSLIATYDLSSANKAQSAGDCLSSEIDISGTLTANRTFTFYLDPTTGTGKKSYVLKVLAQANASGPYALTLTTGIAGSSSITVSIPTMEEIQTLGITVDGSGNVIETTNTIQNLSVAVATATTVNATTVTATTATASQATIDSGTVTATIYAASNSTLQGVITQNGSLESTSFVSGSSGWSLNSDGTFEFNQSTTSRLYYKGGTLTLMGAIQTTSGTIGGAVITSSTIKSSNYVAGSSGWCLDNGAGILYAVGVTVSGTINSASGSIGGWILGTSTMTSAASGSKVVLDQGNSRFTVYDSGGNAKTAMGYLGGLANPSGGTLASSAYGFWAAGSDALRIYGGSTTSGAVNMINYDGAYAIYDNTGTTERLCLGSVSGQYGVFSFGTYPLYLGASGTPALTIATGGNATFSSWIGVVSPNATTASSTGAVQIADYPGNPGSGTIQWTNNSRTSQYGYIGIYNNGTIVLNSSNGTIEATAGNYTIYLGTLSNSWSGTSGLPVIYSSSSDLWIMLANPHLPYLTTSGLTGAAVRMAADGTASTFWDMGIGRASVGTDCYVIARANTALLQINNAGTLTIGSPSINMGSLIYGETHLSQGAYSDPWSGTVCALKCSGNMGVGGAAYITGALTVGGRIASPNEITGTALSSYGQFRAVYGNYGVILRNDNGCFYILVTNYNDQYGQWRDPIRPFYFNLSSGAVTIDASGVGTTFGGVITAGGLTVTGGTSLRGAVTVGALSPTYSYACNSLSLGTVASNLVGSTPSYSACRGFVTAWGGSISGTIQLVPYLFTNDGTTIRLTCMNITNGGQYVLGFSSSNNSTATMNIILC